MMKKLVLICACAAAILALSHQAFAASTDDEIKVRRIEMVFDSTTVRVNQERTIYVEILPHDADDKRITWTSSNPEVVTVDEEGVLTGISPGTAEITATSHNNKTATCQVTVPGKVLAEIELQTSNAETTAASVNAGETLGAAALRLDAENAAKAAGPGETAVLAYQDKTRTSAAALRSAAFAAEYQGKKVQIRFRTVDSRGKVQGQLTISPEKTGSEEMDIGVSVLTLADRTESARKHAASHLGTGAAVVSLSHQGSFGMAVQVAALVDLTGMDTEKLALYRYDGTGYTPLENQAYRIDEGGYLHFTTEYGGVIAVVSR